MAESVKEGLLRALGREDVQNFLNRRGGKCNDPYCGKNVPLYEDALTLEVLALAIPSVNGFECNLDSFIPRSCHIHKIPGKETKCHGYLFFQQHINPKSEDYNPDLAKLVRIIKKDGIIKEENGKWALGKA